MILANGVVLCGGFDMETDCNIGVVVDTFFDVVKARR